MHEAAKSLAGKSSNDFLTVVNNELIFSYAGTHEKMTSRKRKIETSMEEDVDRVLKGVASRVGSAESDKAREVTVRMLRDLKGTHQERLVQSVVIEHRKLRPSDPGPKVIIAARLASGVPIPIGKLKAALGDCWADGAVSTDSSSELFSSLALPMSEEGILAERLGHASLRLVTALPDDPERAVAHASEAGNGVS
jgi:hypothetical protein